MFADFVRFAFRLKDFAERYLLTGFLYIIFNLPFFGTFAVWCHLAQLHQVR
jgi:hypothetical protein